MVAIKNLGWVANLGEMTCRNTNSKVVVEFQKFGKTYIGKIRDVPIEIMKTWKRLWYGDYLIKSVIMEAEREFSKACNKSNNENKE
jgi:hypothetical protein